MEYLLKIAEPNYYPPGFSKQALTQQYDEASA
jgi:hypothetical protein